MKTIQITAPEGYEIDKEKSTFETIVFKEKKKDLTDFKLFKEFSDLCLAAGTTEIEFNNKWLGKGFDPSTIAFERMKICTKAYNQDWKYNLFDTDQKKWAPYFRVLSSGLGFSFTFYYFDITHTSVGSRLAFKDEATAKHAGETFPKLFEELNNAQY